VFANLKQNLMQTCCSSRSFILQLAKNRWGYQTHTHSCACSSMTTWSGMMLLVSELSLKSPLHNATIVRMPHMLDGSLFHKFGFFMDCQRILCVNMPYPILLRKYSHKHKAFIS